MLLDDDPVDPVPSFPYPIVPPDADPASGDLVKLEINREWLKYVLGCCTVLTRDDIWDVDTEEERILANKRGIDVLTQLSLPLTEPPFYDDDETADDVQLPTAPWYEDVSDWIIAAFLATTFTPGAAIVYTTTIPRLRLAFRTGNLGAIVRVLLDDIEIWTGNTNAPTVGLLEHELDISGFAAQHNLGNGPYTLKVVHGGAPLGIVPLAETSTYKLEVELGDVRPQLNTFEFRQNGCVLEASIDGQSWATLYDPTSCIAPLIDQAVNDAIADNLISFPPNQSGPQPAPEAGVCKTFKVQLAGNNTWISPVTVKTGDTITVSNGDGAWNDGFLEGFLLWQCPDGRAVGIGQCTVPDDPDPSDPLQTAYHMKLVGRNSQEWFDPWLTYTVPAGITDEAFILQANDSDLSDNKGSVTFDVTICSGMWTHTFDFKVSAAGWVADSGGNCTATPGQGISVNYRVGSSPYYYQARGHYNFTLPVGSTVTKLDYYFEGSQLGSYTKQCQVANGSGGNPVGINLSGTYPSPQHSATLNYNASGAARIQFLYHNNAGSGLVFVTKIVVTGKGTAPTW